MNLTNITDEVSCDAFVKGIIKKTLWFTLGGALLLLILGQSAHAKGLAMGGLASAANFFLMALWLPRALGRRRAVSEALSLLSVIPRFGIMGGALGLCLYFRSQFSVAACAVGLFAVQFSLFLDNYWRGRRAARFSGSR